MYSDIIANKQYCGLNPVQFGHEACKSSHHYGPAIRTHWLLHFVVSGKGFFIINGNRYDVNSGMMFVIPPFVETYYEADIDNPWEYIWVGFTGEPPMELDDVVFCPHALKIFEQMKTSKEFFKGKSAFLCSKLWELFSVLIENTESNRDYIEDAVNLIHSEYMNDITVQQIASRVNLERTYFSTLFKEKIGISPKQYLLNYRMERARFLLKNGYSVTVTAYSVGYSDVFLFSKMFKRCFGNSPTKDMKTIEKAE